MKRKLQNFIFVLIFIAGLSLLLYPYIANEWNTYRQSQLITTYDDKIAEIENIAVSQEAIDAEYNTIAETYKVDVEVAKKAIDEKVIVDDLKGRATMDFVKAEAKITENK